ncbi:MAG: hypothetical protein RRZ84_06435 [Romboutsia sp.]
MNKLAKISVWILIVVLIFMGGVYYMIIPKHSITFNESYKTVTIEDLIKGSYIDKFEVLSKPIRLKGNLVIKNEDFKNIIYTTMKKYDLEEFKTTHIEINNNKLNITFPYKVLNVIDTQGKVDLFPTVIDDSLIINLENLEIGKLNLNNKRLESILKDYKKDIPFEVKENMIIIDKSYLKPITLKGIDIKENELLLNIEVKMNNIIEFIKENNLKVIA